MGHGKYIDPFCHSERSEESRSEESYYQVQAGETLDLQFVVLPGESKDIEVSVDLCGPGAQAHLKGLYLCKADEKVNFRIVMHHKAAGCKSTQLINGIAGGQAQVHFDGTIVVAPDGKGKIYASARSIGELNVQILMEKLGGGGNRSAAEAQFTGISMEEAVDRVLAAIDEYLN